jgi:hypothetical protein
MKKLLPQKLVVLLYMDNKICMPISCKEHAETVLRPLGKIVQISVQKPGQGLVAPLSEIGGKLDSKSRRISQNLSESLESFGIFEILNPRTPKF